ncbi:hypothetical protein BH11BAC7_BH11BAC7_23660 [soil metagenome]
MLTPSEESGGVFLFEMKRIIDYCTFEYLISGTMNKYEYNELVVDFFDDASYKEGSADNKYAYSKHYFSNEKAKQYRGSNHGIKVYDFEGEINNCLLTASVGRTWVHKTSSLLADDQLVICCSNFIFCIKIPTLELLWKTEVDSFTCLQIYKFQDDYIVHGELLVSRIDANGNIKWQFGGKDIFISIENQEEFRIEADHISLVDFGSTEYKIDFDGKLISEKQIRKS